MYKIQVFMYKYGYYVHALFGIFWLWILYGSFTVNGFTYALFLPILFLVLTGFNIYKLWQAKNVNK